MKRPIFIGMIMAYAVLLISKKLELYFPELINSYLSDLLCIPIVLSVARYGIAYWFNDANFQLNKLHIASATLSFIIVFEQILPSINTVYTADIIDGVMYIIGAIIFHTFQSPYISSKLNTPPKD